ncbi:type II secretion system F family protein [Candidatus Micrarchaeota archaeon]|nr:type II secretion system F family protein [Candidatus Micrarchaeota archaeon]
MKVPFSILPPPVVEKIATVGSIARAGNVASTFFPHLGEQLIQVSGDVHHRTYMAQALVASFFNFFFLFVGSIALYQITQNPDILWQGPLVALFMGFISLITIVNYPRIIARKQARNIENELIPAMRQLLIQVKSGVPLFDAMASICADYGSVSREFRKMVKKINGGLSIESTFEEESKRTPSKQLKRILWHISNALKVGTDVGIALEEIIEDLTKERIDDIRRYGQELSPWTMIYMLAAIIVPSLGITMMLVVISFLGVQVPPIFFAFTLLFIIGFQLFFMDFVRSRRPAVEDV